MIAAIQASDGKFFRYLTVRFIQQGDRSVTGDAYFCGRARLTSAGGRPHAVTV
jgi:hypothetical protein